MGGDLEPKTPEGRQVLEAPKELGVESPKRVDFEYLQKLGHVAGNPFYEEEQQGA